MLLEPVRLVVDDERAPVDEPEDVEPALQEDAVVLEREPELGPHALEAAQPARELERRQAATSASIRARSSSVAAG